MLERIMDAPVHTLAFKASGTVMERDVDAAIEAAIGRSTASTGVVIVIDRDFDGYLAELARGLTNASLAHKNLVKLAVVADPDLMGEARLSGFDVPAVPIRLFPTSDRNTAYAWADAARRGE